LAATGCTLFRPGAARPVKLDKDAASKMGRYVDLKKASGNNYLLDFNMAYNPACAFSEYYNCPVPPKENTLAVPIRAGEMNPHYH
jgi:uncharacterized protein